MEGIAHGRATTLSIIPIRSQPELPTTPEAQKQEIAITDLEESCNLLETLTATMMLGRVFIGDAQSCRPSGHCSRTHLADQIAKSVHLMSICGAPQGSAVGRYYGATLARKPIVSCTCIRHDLPVCRSTRHKSGCFVITDDQSSDHSRPSSHLSEAFDVAKPFTLRRHVTCRRATVRKTGSSDVKKRV